MTEPREGLMADIPGTPGVEIVGPFKSYELIINGWRVPLVDCREMDGGNVMFILDGRMAYEVPAGEFENTALLVADTIAVALGYGAHPNEEYETADQIRERSRHVHWSIRPTRVIGISGVMTEEACEPPDDPRNDA